MVKSKKKTNNKGRQLLKSKKQYGGMLGYQPLRQHPFSGIIPGNSRIVHSPTVTREAMNSLRGFQNASTQVSHIISAIEAPKWGTSKGASTYIKLKNNLIRIRRANIDAMNKINSLLSDKSPEAFKNIKELSSITSGSRNHKIIQIKNEIKSSFKDVSVPRKLDKSELYNSVSQRVHLTRGIALQHLHTLVLVENISLNDVLKAIISDKENQSISQNIADIDM